MAHTKTASVPDKLGAAIDAKGRVPVPAALRERLGWKPGDKLVLEVTPEGELRITSVARVVRRFAGILAHLGPPDRLISEELIRERRQEARREDRG